MGVPQTRVRQRGKAQKIAIINIQLRDTIMENMSKYSAKVTLQLHCKCFFTKELQGLPVSFFHPCKIHID